MAAAASKKEFRRNPLAEWVVWAVEFARAQLIMILTAAVILVVVGVAGAGYWWYQSRREDEAGRALALATVALRGSQPGTPGNPDVAMKDYDNVAEQYRGTRSAEEALIALGNLQFDAGKIDEALGSFRQYLSTYPRGHLRLIAALGEAYAQEAKGDFQGAAQGLSSILDRDKQNPLAGEAYISLGRVYEELKKPDEALRVYGQVVERYGQTQWAQQALQRMSSIKK